MRNSEGRKKMIVQVRDTGKDGKFIGYLAGYAIYDSESYVLIAKDDMPLFDRRVDEVAVMLVEPEGAE